MLLLDIEEGKSHALKTICGAIHYQLVQYNPNEIPIYDYSLFCDYLKIPKGTIYCVEVEATGFWLTTRIFRFKYVHSDFHDKRVLYYQAS